MEYIRRDLEKKILSLVKEYSCILLYRAEAGWKNYGFQRNNGA